MKICVLGFPCDSVEALIADESLVNLRRVMDAGLYGMLEAAAGWGTFATSQVEGVGPTIAQCVEEAGSKSLLLGEPAIPGEQPKAATSWYAAEEPWSYLQAIEPKAESISALDQQLGLFLESMDNETILLVCAISRADQNGLFALAAPNCPLSGEFEGARLTDLAPTLLDLAGYKVPESMQGKCLVAGMEKKSLSEHSGDDQLVQDRLAGLGYV